MANNSNVVENGIKVEAYEDFGGLLESKITTTMELGATINKLFRPIFNDYEGCTILPDQFGIFQLTLFFKDRGEAEDGKIKNIQSIVQKVQDKSDVMARIQNLNRSNSTSKFELTEDTKKLLEEFLPYNPNKNVNWKQFIVESTERTNLGTGLNIYIKVFGLDLYKILRKIYGGKDKTNGNRVEYMISMIRPTMQVSGGTATNFLINISQLDTKKVEKLYAEMGMIPSQGTFIVRD